jgi:hypothetical protein
VIGATDCRGRCRATPLITVTSGIGAASLKSQERAENSFPVKASGLQHVLRGLIVGLHPRLHACDALEE